MSAATRQYSASTGGEAGQKRLHIGIRQGEYLAGPDHSVLNPTGVGVYLLVAAGAETFKGYYIGRTVDADTELCPYVVSKRYSHAELKAQFAELLAKDCRRSGLRLEGLLE